jgi:hypothetical protein
MEFRTLGVDFISHQENVDTTTPWSERAVPHRLRWP